MKKRKKTKKKATFRIHLEIRQYRGIVKDMAEKLGKTRQSVYYGLRNHNPDYVKVQIPYTEAFNAITGKEFTPEELFSSNEK